MGMKTRQIATDSPKAEVGEIDTRAPFESVKAAVSLFGEGALSSEKLTIKKPKPLTTERPLAKETELHLAQKELNKLKEQLTNAEITRLQALAELDVARKSVDDLTHKLNTINESKESAVKATEDANNQTKQLEEVSFGDQSGQDVSWKRELDSSREQYALAVTELHAAKQELRRFRKDFDTVMDANVSALQQEVEANQSSDANKEKAAQLSNEIAAVHESLVHVNHATEQAKQEESIIISEKDARRQSHRRVLQETEKKLVLLQKEFDPELHKTLEAKLAETNIEIGGVQKQIENAKTADLETISTVTIELDGAKEALQKVVEEESSLHQLVESLKIELNTVKKEHSELKVKDVETESIVGNLHVKLRKCKAELEAANSSESKTTLASDELISALQQLSVESENALQEAEAMKKSAAELRIEAEAARVALDEAEKKLQVALKDAEEAKAAEVKALDQIKALSEKANAARASTSESGANITISAEEYNSLSKKVEESEKLAEMKVAAAASQVEAVKASENEAIKRLEAIQKEMEDMETATEEALKRAEMAEAAKKAVEGEMRRWREREQKKAAETASRILAESQTYTEALPPPWPKNLLAVEKTVENQKVRKSHSTKKTLLPSLSAMFHRKKNQVDGGSPSYLPGEKPDTRSSKGKKKSLTEGSGTSAVPKVRPKSWSESIIDGDKEEMKHRVITRARVSLPNL